MKLSLLVLLTFTSAAAPLAVSQGSQTSRTRSEESRIGPAFPYWSEFVHPLAAYQFPVPPGVRSAGAPAGSSEAAFQSSDGSFLISAWGGQSTQSAASLLEEQWRAAEGRPGRTVTYRRRARSWFVVSGTGDDGAEFYEKLITRGNQVAAFTLTYPRSRLREFEPWVEKIEDGFRILPEASNIPVAARSRVPAVTAAPPRVAPQPRDQPRVTSPSAATRSVDRPRPAPAERTTPRQEATVSRKTPEPDAPRREPLPSEVKVPEPSSRATVNSGEPAKDPGAVRKFAGKEMPVGSKVTGKPGFVYSPFVSDKSIVDVVGIPSGTKVKCPYSSQVFLVP